jgi:hypothetical protein
MNDSSSFYSATNFDANGHSVLYASMAQSDPALLHASSLLGFTTYLSVAV